MSGHDLVRQIEQLPVDRNSRPLQDAVISSCGELVRQVKGTFFPFTFSPLTFNSFLNDFVAKKEKKEKKKRKQEDSSSSDSDDDKKKKKDKKRKKKSKDDE